MTLTNQLFFAFDLDGVLVDTIDTLFTSYLNILESFGAIGTTEEFDFLNGKNIEEIAEHLTNAHQLSCDESELVALFQIKFDSLYAKVDLVPGAHAILTFVASQGAKIALASSSSRKNIDIILERFNLEPFFELVVSGDEVANAKPSPDIYNLVKDHFNTNRCFVIEDSANGIQAARRAGLIPVLFDPRRQSCQKNASFVVNELREIEQIVGVRRDQPILISRCRQVELEPTQTACRLSEKTRVEVEKTWQAELEKNPALFNGPIVTYQSHHVNANNTLIIKACVSEYKFFGGQMEDEAFNGVRPLAVSGVVVDAQQRFLIGKRSDDVTQYPGLFEFVPSGGISAQRITSDCHEEQLVVELEEETGIRASSITQISPFGLIYDPTHRVYDVAVLVRLGIALDASTIKSSEYSEFTLLDARALKVRMNETGSDRNGLENTDFVPTSRVMFSALWDDFGLMG